MSSREIKSIYHEVTKALGSKTLKSLCLGDFVVMVPPKRAELNGISLYARAKRDIIHRRVYRLL